MARSSINFVVMHSLVFQDPATAGRDQTARITSKENCMKELLMRLMDVSARVRCVSC